MWSHELDLESLLLLAQQLHSTSRVVGLAAIFATTYALVCFLQYILDWGNRKFWSSHAWAGVKHRVFPKTRAGLNAIRRTREIVEEGYGKVKFSETQLRQGR